jgi:LPPG:FO 2-phospho-L-lactate transferase
VTRGPTIRDKVVALSGGVGGAKLALGLSRVMDPSRLTVVANTGDDFVHLGLHVSPDIDTLLYTLAGLANPETGWGRRDETWSFMRALAALGGESWFNLGDGDLATHVERTRRLAAGESLSAVTADFARRLGISSRIVPMSDDPVRTRLDTDEGWLELQHYFVRRRCEPAVRAVEYEGAAAARAHGEVLAALGDPALRAVVICPSNPFISIGPILALPGMRQALVACAAPVVAVAPLIAGRAVKGPSDRMMRELGHEPSAAGVARLYADVIDAYVIDRQDSGAGLPMRVVPAETLMVTLADREALARAVLAVADGMAAR